MLLARRGYRVLVVDRARFPSDTVSAHYIGPSGMASLDRWGLGDAIRRSNCAPIEQFFVDLDEAGSFVVDLVRGTFRWGAFVAEFPVENGRSAGYCPRRRILDPLLLEAAAAAGVEVREGWAVTDLVLEDGRVAGVVGRSGGRETVERARLVVGADGLHSLVARRAKAPVYDERPAFTCAYHAYFSGVPAAGMEFYAREGRALMAVPTNDGLTLVGAGWRSEEFARVRGNLEHEFGEALALAPALAERVAAGTQVEPFSGKAALPNFFRRPYGPGWALVGDAGYHRDPIVGQGITDAFRDADLLAAAIDDGLSGRLPLDDALAA
jgi:flavin-dependent dehydrogenase